MSRPKVNSVVAVSDRGFESWLGIVNSLAQDWRGGTPKLWGYVVQVYDDPIINLTFRADTVTYIGEL